MVCDSLPARSEADLTWQSWGRDMKLFRTLKKYIVPLLLGGGLFWILDTAIPAVYSLLVNEPPAVEQLTVSPNKGASPLVVEAQIDATDPESDRITYSWHLNDEKVSEDNNASQTFSLNDPGTHILKVIISDGGSEKIERSATITVNRRELKKILFYGLREAYSLIEPHKKILLPDVLVTNGHALKITAHTISSSSGKGVEIFAFRRNKAPNGVSGADGHHGTDGQAKSGESGGHGAHGAHGNPGKPGADAGEIILEAHTVAVPIKIHNSGQGGGDGGHGGKGGDGGGGGTGQDALDRLDSSRTFELCRRPAGLGGGGGDGGDGGRGGDAGAGGDGGRVTIVAAEAKKISIEALGGSSGLAGKGGKRGAGGNEGGPGTNLPSCGPPIGKTGTGGVDGSGGADGDSKAAGNQGVISAQIGIEMYRVQDGSFSYP